MQLLYPLSPSGNLTIGQPECFAKYIHQRLQHTLTDCYAVIPNGGLAGLGKTPRGANFQKGRALG